MGVFLVPITESGEVFGFVFSKKPFALIEERLLGFLYLFSIVSQDLFGISFSRLETNNIKVELY